MPKKNFGSISLIYPNPPSFPNLPSFVITPASLLPVIQRCIVIVSTEGIPASGDREHTILLLPANASHSPIKHAKSHVDDSDWLFHCPSLPASPNPSQHSFQILSYPSCLYHALLFAATLPCAPPQLDSSQLHSERMMTLSISVSSFPPTVGGSMGAMMGDNLSG